MFRSTLDIDSDNKKNLKRILEKIRHCINCKEIKVRTSDLKGYHIILFCKKKCDVCRIVYDDTRRVAYDANRPEYARNILFEKKERVKIE